MSVASTATETFIPKEDLLELFDNDVDELREDLNLTDNIVKKMREFLDIFWDFSNGNIVKPAIENHGGNNGFSLTWHKLSEGVVFSASFVKSNNKVLLLLYTPLFGNSCVKSFLGDYHDISAMSDTLKFGFIATKRDSVFEDRKNAVDFIREESGLGNLESFRNVLDKEVDEMSKKASKLFDDPSNGYFDDLKKLSPDANPVLSSYDINIKESIDNVSEIMLVETGKKPTKKELEKITSYITKVSALFFKPEGDIFTKLFRGMDAINFEAD